jgi:ribosomal protein L16 Arg81 hydroxylase
VVVEGVTEDWPAFESWSLDGLAERHGSARLVVARREREDSVWFSHVPMALRDYIALVRDPDQRRRYYLSDAPYEREAPELARDVRRPSLVPDDARSALWISTTGKRAYTHFDVDHSLLSQVVGKKRIYLMPPRSVLRLHTSPIFNEHWPQSPVDLAAPDLRSFPRMAGAEIFDCVIGPGDALFIPALWWHQVHSQEDSISVSFHWEGRRERLVRFGVRLLGRRYAG